MPRGAEPSPPDDGTDHEREAAVERPQLVLDYASPRPRVKLRLAANSILRHEMVDDGRCVITEALAGKQSAVLGVAFAAFVLGNIPVQLLNEPTLTLKRSGDVLGFLCFLAIAMVALSLRIVHNTWRRTVLSADRRRVEVIFTGPLTPTRRYSAPPASLEKIEVAAMDADARLGELRIAPLDGAELHLFTDHPFADVHRLAQSIAAALGEVVSVSVTVTVAQG
jgi:hypothetical protein